MSEQSWPVSWSRQLDRLRRHPATLTWPGGSTRLIEFALRCEEQFAE